MNIYTVFKMSMLIREWCTTKTLTKRLYRFGNYHTGRIISQTRTSLLHAAAVE